MKNNDGSEVATGPADAVAHFETASGTIYVVPYAGEDPWQAVERVAKRHGVKTSDVVVTAEGVVK
jgi:hypothetical protein